MKFIKNILRTLFGIYAALVFAITLIISFICYFLVFTIANKKAAPFIAHAGVSKPWGKFIFIMYGIRVKTHGKKLLNPDQTYVFIGNHRSLLDIPSYALSTPHVIRFLAKKELTKIPLFGYMLERLYITVDRKDKVARARSMEKMMQSIKDGISVFICPEGTRNKSKEPLLPFHDGAFRLAIQTQTPMAVLAVKNSNKLLSPNNPIALRPGVIHCYWSEPIVTKGMTQDDIGRLKEMAGELLKKHLQ
jgi:1-acyl-sn-glycerol-3-phosphate acyltransferase